jgi:hypothetical protein
MSWEGLAPACGRADLSMVALHLRYVALGGVASLRELSAHFASGAPVMELEHDTAVLALNERFLELHDAERVPYESARGRR